MGYCISLLIGVLLDQITKYWASQALSFWVEVPVLGPLTFQLVHNYGAAYGILSHQRALLISVSIGVLIIGIIYRKSIGLSALSRWGMTCIGIGTIGNLIDRIRVGYVIDYINIQIIPIFNIADIAINIGAALFIIEFFWMKNREVG